jgi:hypothetical protein
VSAGEWREELLAAAARETPEQEARFLSLVDMVGGRVTPDVAKALLATFNSTPDSGTQERVCSVLASAPLDTQVRAILDEMPRLLREAPEWAEALIGELIEHELPAIQRHVRTVSAEVRFALSVLLSRGEFCDFYPNAKLLYAYCK